MSPDLTNIFFMNWFEENVLEKFNVKPVLWFRYIDDTFIIWQYGTESVDCSLFLCVILNACKIFVVMVRA